MNSALQITIILALMLATALALAWVGWDAKQRNRNAAMVVLLCLLTWPLGFLFWRMVRPPPAV